MSISRREFLGTTTLAVTAGPLLAAKGDKAAMPTRMLGKTGARVSILAFGCGQPIPEIRRGPGLRGAYARAR